MTLTLTVNRVSGDQQCASKIIASTLITYLNHSLVNGTAEL